MADTRTPVAAPRQQFINLDLVRRIVLCDGLNGTSRSVLLTVGMHASQDRQQCFCSIATLARKSGWSRRTGTNITRPRASPTTAATNQRRHPQRTSCIPPKRQLRAPHAPTVHKQGVKQGLEQPREEEAARPVFCLQSSLPAGQIDANTIGLLSAQRQRNGKDPLAHRDILHMGTQAAKAGLTPLAAAQWVLASPKRNFFKADFYAPPLVQPAVLRPAAAPSGHTPPRPTPLTSEQQAEQDRAREAGLAHIRQCLAKMPPVDHQRTATARPSTAANTRWATNAIEQFMAGHPVSRYRLHSACEVLGIHPRTLQRQVA